MYSGVVVLNSRCSGASLLPGLDVKVPQKQFGSERMQLPLAATDAARSLQPRRDVLSVVG